MKFAILLSLLSASTAFAGANPIEIICTSNGNKVVEATVPHIQGGIKNMDDYSITDWLGGAASTSTSSDGPGSPEIVMSGSMEIGNLEFSISGPHYIFFSLKTLSTRVVKQDQFNLETQIVAAVYDVNSNVETIVNCGLNYAK